MKELRHFSPIILQNSVLTCRKAEIAFFLFVCFFSIWIFFHKYSRVTGQQGKGEAISLYPFYHFHPFHWTLAGLLLQRALRIVLVFAILTIAPLISKSLLGNTPVTMAILQKCLDTFSSFTSTISLTLIFGEFIFNFDVRCISCKFTTYSCLQLSQK